MGGGGGGSSRGLTPSEVRKLSEVVTEKINAAAQPKCNVFISFAAEDLKEVNLLRGQAKNENSAIEFNDWSLKTPFDSKNADYVKNGIRERIRQSSVTIVYLSASTSASKWVDWEIRESIALGKGVVAMYKGDAPPAGLPSAIAENRIKVVPWNQQELSAAIVACRAE
ncbi:MAG: TIR domain-containing protein [Candidatus Koribacter versatilis]|uniref:TIR domain-containing protein n=1 Tax=Candidatus Korobacter versatilis TaxID=658062 RepID=A0A932A7M4_9BACT|nr:TIR domain-containing protein [Candidatus Koribacter versatilis]